MLELETYRGIDIGVLFVFITCVYVWIEREIVLCVQKCLG